MPIKPRYLTKSRFKLALDCPTKLFYTRKKEYTNASETDTFLQALAEGGFQVEELARMEYPDGYEIIGEDYNYEGLVKRTNVLLEQENVVIFEPAFLFEGLFIRVDILVKKGDKIQLIEVKAKSIDSQAHQSFIKQRGGLNMAVYLYDVAFQQYVMQKSFPHWQITPYLMLVDKSKQTTVNGLNQHFKISQNSELRTGITKTKGLTKSDLGVSILAKIKVEEEVKYIYNTNPLQEGISFEETINLFQQHYEKDIKINTPIGMHCKSCEFKNTMPTTTSKSGFHECWQKQTQLSVKKINEPKVYNVWNFIDAKKIVGAGKFFMNQLTENDINIKPEAEKLSNSERRWLQVEKTIAKDTSAHFETEGLKDELNSWKFPLNFIDFETTAVAIPFTAGKRPYEQTAFQFSHHIVYEDGRVAHANEYINTQIGVSPNLSFIRALKKALEINTGSVFRYHNHENTILNTLHSEIKKSDEPDKESLLCFIESITHNTGKSALQWKGDRDMIDLYQVVKNYYFDPATGGSISIKAILPSVLNQSTYLQQKYKLSLKELQVTSKNFGVTHRFVEFDGNTVKSPYTLLPPVFDNWSTQELDNAVSGLSKLADGGTALTAYAKLQFSEVSQQEREAIEKALLRYCEVDTLAMVMIYECFREVCK